MASRNLAKEVVGAVPAHACRSSGRASGWDPSVLASSCRPSTLARASRYRSLAFCETSARHRLFVVLAGLQVPHRASGFLHTSQRCFLHPPLISLTWAPKLFSGAGLA